MFGHIRLLGNFPESQVVGCRCTSLAENSSISLAGSEERIHFSQQSSLLPPPYWKARRPWGRGWLVCLLIPRDIAFIPSILKRLLRWQVSWGRSIVRPSLDPNSSCVLIGVERGKVPLQLFRTTSNLVPRVFRLFGGHKSSANSEFKMLDLTMFISFSNVTTTAMRNWKKYNLCQCLKSSFLIISYYKTRK